MAQTTNTYDQYAEVYAQMIAERDEEDPVTSALLSHIGDVSSLRVLDAGCGEGHLARILSERGAHVTAIDVSPRLVEMGRLKDPEGIIDFRSADLSEPLEGIGCVFDLVASDLVLNDVPDHVGFAATLSSVTRPGGRVVLSMNNPYSYVIRKQVENYFDSGFSAQYRGMSKLGLKVYFYHRTLQDYVEAFAANGLLLDGLADVPHTITRDNSLLPVGARFPYFMILAFRKN